MRTTRKTPASPLLVGSIILMTAIVGVVISYNASRGLPFVPTYDVQVAVPDAAELVPGSSEVRLGGARVGIVDRIDAIPARDGRPTHARLTLALDQDQDHLPVDSTVQVRPRSILGAKVVDLVRGTSARRVPPGGVLPLRQAIAGVQLDEAFAIFGPGTRRAIQRAVTGLGDAFAGRGSAFNTTVREVRRLLPPLQRAAETLAAPGTDLDGFVRGAASASRAFAPVGRELAAAIGDGGRTARAIADAGAHLDRALVRLPRTEVAARRAALRVTPVLADAAALAADLRPGAAQLRPAGRALERALRTADPALAVVPRLSRGLDGTVASLGRLAADPATAGALRQLTTTVTTLDSTLDVLLPAQTGCNVIGLAGHNLSEILAVGDAQAPWLNFLSVLDLSSQSYQQARPSPNLHAVPTPRNDETECETGNEPWLPGQRIGSPAGLQPVRTASTKLLEGGR